MPVGIAYLMHCFFFFVVGCIELVCRADLTMGPAKHRKGLKHRKGVTKNDKGLTKHRKVRQRT